MTDPANARDLFDPPNNDRTATRATAVILACERGLLRIR
jgi:hypothetical protein